MAIKFKPTGKQCLVDDYAVKAVKSFTGREGYGFECSLYREGKKVGTVTDTASGGQIDFYLNKGEEEILDKHCASLPKEQWSEDSGLTKAQWDEYWKGGKEIDKDGFVTSLVTKWEERKQFKTICRTKTVVKVVPNNSMEKTQHYTYKIKFDQISVQLREKIIAEYPNATVSFVNEEI
jgi:hypothetical protein